MRVSDKMIKRYIEKQREIHITIYNNCNNINSGCHTRKLKKT